MAGRMSLLAEDWAEAREEHHDADRDDLELQPLYSNLSLSSAEHPRATDDSSRDGAALKVTPSLLRYLPKARMGYLLSAAVVACTFIFFCLVIGAETKSPAEKTLLLVLSFSDALIALSYFLIPGAMFVVVLLRRDMGTHVWIVLMFGAFIVCCGLTHAVSSLRHWAYSEWLMAAMKVMTAAVSYATAIAVYRLIPLALQIPSPVQLEREIIERKAAQGKLQSRFERSVVTMQVTRDIRKNLQLGAICRSTAEYCAAVFNADECTLYRHKAKELSSPEEELVPEEKDGQSQSVDWDTDRASGPQGDNHHYVVLSDHAKVGSGDERTAPLPDEDGAHYDQPSSPRQWHSSWPKQKMQRRAPPLHLLPDFLCQHRRAVVIDVTKGLALTHRDDGHQTCEVAEELLGYFREREVAWVMCIALPYHATSCAAIVLQVKRNSVSLRPDGSSAWWTAEDVEQLEEISAQVEVGLAHAHLLQAAERGRQLTNINIALGQAKAAAEACSRAKSQFLAVMSHEIRTPMNAICGMTKVLKKSDMPREQLDCVQIISSSAKALLSLVNNILDFSKIEAGQTEIHEKAFDVRSCIDNTMGLMSSYAAGKTGCVTLSTLIDSRVPGRVVGDKQHLRQVLINLLSNALKFTQQGSVTLRASLQSVSTNPATHETMADIRFEVTDTGIGIPRGKLDRLFHPFSQVDSGFTRKYEGTGLGLAISMRLCEMMGGTIWVRSQEGKGSTFGFNIPFKLEQMSDLTDNLNLPQSDDTDSKDSLDFSNELSSSSSSSSPSGSSYPLPSSSAPSSPLQQPSHPTAVSAARYRRRVYSTQSRSLPDRIRPVSPLPSRESLAGDDTISAPLYRPQTLGATPVTSPLRLLLAEDNLVNQKVAFKLLSRLGFYNVESVANGIQAVERVTQAAQQPFDAVLMDLHMPEMDGITASKVIKQRLRERAPYIIACTADLQYDTRTACVQAGIDNYLEKPIKLRELAQVLGAVTTHRLAQQSTVMPSDRPGGGQAVQDLLAAKARPSWAQERHTQLL